MSSKSEREFRAPVAHERTKNARSLATLPERELSKTIARFSVVALLLCGAILASAQSEPTFTVYPVPGIWGAPAGIATGSDGALWFTSGNSIWRSTTTGVMTEYPLPDDGIFYPQGRGASDIVPGPDGALWFTEIFASKIGRITTAGLISEYSLPTGDRGPMKIATGSDGVLWFTEWISQNGDVGRITTSGVVSRQQLSTCSGACLRYPLGITAGPHGALWVTDVIHGAIYRITTGGVISNYDLPPSPYGIQPGDIISGPDGALWFTLADTVDSHDYIGRITTAGVITSYPLPTSYNGYNRLGPNSIAAGPDDALWFTHSQANVIGRMTTRGNVTLYALPPVPYGGQQPRSITLGPDGALWITNSGCIVRAALLDNTPPLITLSASPTMLWPPNGKMVPVVVRGTIKDLGSGLQTSAFDFTVIDEYHQVQPTGHIGLNSAGNYAFTILLQASRRGDDKNGRQYVIRVSATDNAGNRGVKWTSVRVPH